MATILLVDDIPPVRKLFRRLLEQQGFAVLEAEDAFRALELYSAHSVDLLITDLDMPGMTGDELIRRLSPARFLIVSAGSQPLPEDWPRLRKPVAVREFLEMVRGCLAQQRTGLT